jgi:hypothetical protein
MNRGLPWQNFKGARLNPTLISDFRLQNYSKCICANLLRQPWEINTLSSFLKRKLVVPRIEMKIWVLGV